MYCTLVYYIPNKCKTFKPDFQNKTDFAFCPCLTYSWTTCLHKQQLRQLTLPHHTYLKNRTAMTMIIPSHTPLQAAILSSPIPSSLWSFSFPIVLKHLSSINPGKYYTSGINLVSIQQQALLRIKGDLKSFSVIFTYIKSVVKWDAVTLK